MPLIVRPNFLANGIETTKDMEQLTIFEILQLVASFNYGYVVDTEQFELLQTDGNGALKTTQSNPKLVTRIFNGGAVQPFPTEAIGVNLYRVEITFCNAHLTLPLPISLEIVPVSSAWYLIPPMSQYTLQGYTKPIIWDVSAVFPLVSFIELSSQ